jgi:hypothetical protein
MRGKEMPILPSSSENLSPTLPPTGAATSVRDQLARIVNSSGFVSSTRLCRLLTHIVNRTIDGDVDSLKELSIAMEVFDLTSEYDPSIDAIVRVEARRLECSKQSRMHPEIAGISEGFSEQAEPLGSACSQRINFRSSTTKE